MRFNNSPVGGLSCLKIPQELLPYALVSPQRMHSNWSKWAYILQIIFTEETNISRQNKKHLYLVPLVWLLRSCLWSLYTCKHLSFLHWIFSPPAYASSGCCWVLALAINTLLFLLVLLWSNALLCFYSEASLFSKVQLKYTHLLFALSDFPTHSLLFSLCWSADNWFSRDLRYSLL